MKKIGVFICHCGINIASTVDVKKVAEAVKDVPGVEVSTEYIYMCSDPGQNLVKETIAEKGLDGIVVAACSPTLHENTFRSASQLAGLNPYVVEMANIREQCSWVHTDKDSATKKATKRAKAVGEINPSQIGERRSPHVRAPGTISRNRWTRASFFSTSLLIIVVILPLSSGHYLRRGKRGVLAAMLVSGLIGVHAFLEEGLLCTRALTPILRPISAAVEGIKG